MARSDTVAKCVVTSLCTLLVSGVVFFFTFVKEHECVTMGDVKRYVTEQRELLADAVAFARVEETVAQNAKAISENAASIKGFAATFESYIRASEGIRAKLDALVEEVRRNYERK